MFSLAEMIVSPVVMAVKLKFRDNLRTVGVAFVDANERTFGVSEFQENDLFSNLESLIIQLSVKECLISNEADDYEMEKLKQVLRRCDVVVTQQKWIDCGDGVSEYNQLVKHVDMTNSFEEYVLASSVMAWLFDYLEVIYLKYNAYLTS